MCWRRCGVDLRLALSAALLAWACGRVGARHTAHTRHRTRERNIRMKMSSKLKLYTLTVL